VDLGWTADSLVNVTHRDRVVVVGAEPREARLRRVLDEQIDFIGRTLRAFGAGDGDVDDGVQQVCLVLAEKLDVLEPAAERAFLFSTAHRIAFRLRRSRARRAEVPFDESLEPNDPSDPERLHDERRAFDVLADLLDGLDEDLRQVFVLYEIEDMTMAAIAELLKVPPGTVASRLRRAREEFHERASRFRRKESRGP
jgi:RNA polymerase sigma-70 factor (ECF subfamily)